MSRFPSLPDQPHLFDVFQKFGRGIWPLCKFHDVVLRGESEWSVGERELMAAYVSGLNACSFCHGAHAMIAEVHGIEAKTLELLFEKPEQAEVSPQLAATLVYLRKLTESPARLTDTDAQAVFEAGVSEQALYDAITVCGIFNLMNRIVEGMGVMINKDNLAASRGRHEAGVDDRAPYRGFARELGFGPGREDV